MMSKLYSTLFLSCALFALSGCQTLDIADKFIPEATDATPETVASPEGAWVQPAPSDVPENDWIGTFDDPVLTALIDEAMETNPTIRLSQASYEASLNGVTLSDAALLPQINGSASISRSESLNEIIPGQTGFNSGVNASWEIDLWGRLRDAVTSSELSAEAALANYAGTRLAIAGQVAQVWINILQGKLLTDLSVDDVDTQARALRLTTRRFEGGLTDSSDVRLSRSALANAESLQSSRQQALASTKRLMETLLRRYPAEAISASNDLPELPALTGTGTPANLLLRRPDILAAERNLRAAGFNVDEARKNLLPQLTLSGGTNSGAGALSDFFDIDAIAANIVAGLSQPLFTGGRLKATIKIQEALLRQQSEAYVNLVLNAYLEVENALNAERSLAIQEEALRISLEESRKGEERIELRYTEGLATILQLLDAQTRRLSAEAALINARANRLSNRISLHVALGGGFETDSVLRTVQSGSSP